MNLTYWFSQNITRGHLQSRQVVCKALCKLEICHNYVFFPSCLFAYFLYSLFLISYPKHFFLLTEKATVRVELQPFLTLVPVFFFTSLLNSLRIYGVKDWNTSECHSDWMFDGRKKHVHQWLRRIFKQRNQSLRHRLNTVNSSALIGRDSGVNEYVGLFLCTFSTSAGTFVLLDVYSCALFTIDQLLLVRFECVYIQASCLLNDIWHCHLT